MKSLRAEIARRSNAKNAAYAQIPHEVQGASQKDLLILGSGTRRPIWGLSPIIA
jgi:hypothetical protein